MPRHYHQMLRLGQRLARQQPASTGRYSSGRRWQRGLLLSPRAPAHCLHNQTTGMPRHDDAQDTSTWQVGMRGSERRAGKAHT